ncbi:hypothetical protein GQ42DRAFT_165633, partial [Ramicandelaber brevisporus]
ASPAQQWTASVSSIDRHYQLVRSSQVRGGGGRGSGSGRESGSGGGSLVVPEEASSSNISSPHQLFSSSASLSVSSPWQLQQQQQLQQQLQLRPQQCGHTSQYFSSPDAESRNSDIDEVKSIQPVLGMTPFIANSPSFSSPTTTTTNTTITSTTAIPAQLSQLSQISQLSQQHNSCTHSQLAVFAQQQRQQSEQHHVLEATEYRRRRGLMGTILLNDTTETTAASATAAGHVQMPIIPVGELANDSNIIDSDDIVMDSDGHDTDIEDNEDNEDNGRRSADYISLAYSAQWAGPSIARMSTVPVDISMDQATMDIDMDNTTHAMAMDNNNDANNDNNGDVIHSTAPMIGPVASAPLPVNYHGVASDIVQQQQQQQQQQHHQQVLNTHSAVQLGSPRSPHVVDSRYTHMKSYVDRSASNSGSDSGAKDRRRSSPFGQLTRFVSQVALIPFKTLRHKLSALGSSNSSSNKNNSSSKNNNNSGNTPVVAASAVTPATVPMNARPGLSFQRKRSNKALIISNPTNFTHIAHIGLDGVVQNDIDPVYQQPDPSETQKGHQAHSRIPSRSNSLIPAAAKSLTLPQSSIAAMAQAAGITPLPVAALPPPPPFLSPSEIPQLPPLPPLTAMSNIGSHFRSVSGTSANFSVSPSSTIRATGSHNKPAGETVRMVSGTNTTLNGKSVPVQYQMSVPQLSVGLLPAPTADYMADPKLDDLTGFDFSYETVFGSTSIKEKLATTTATTNTVNKRMSVMSSLSKRLSGISIF